MNQFAEWINKKYLEWRGGRIGQSSSVSAYARWLGVPQPTVSEWLAGHIVPEQPKSIKALTSKYGREVYQVLYGFDN